MKAEDKWALIASAFIPWLLLWIMSYGFPSWRDAIVIIGPIWLLVSPAISLFFMRLAVDAARREHV